MQSLNKINKKVDKKEHQFGLVYEKQKLKSAGLTLKFAATGGQTKKNEGKNEKRTLTNK